MRATLFDSLSLAKRWARQMPVIAESPVLRPVGGLWIDPVSDPVRVVLGGQEIAKSDTALRVRLPDAGPMFYMPAQHIDMNALHPSERQSTCDWGGRISYFHVIGPNGLIPNAVLFHPEPPAGVAALRGHLAFFEHLVDELWVGDARLTKGPSARTLQEA